MNKLIAEHDNILNRFSVLKDKERLAHAYLFSGPNDVGKQKTALDIAKMLNCDSISSEDEHASADLLEGNMFFCDKCSTCKKINSGNHMDILVVDKGEDQNIKIDKVRNLIARMQMRPFEAKQKVFIIKDVEGLTIEGSNALLKTLEEPSKDSLLILTTSAPDQTLDTIKSRCHNIKFFPVSSERLSSLLEKDFNVSDKQAHFLSFYSEGCPGKAKYMHEDNFFDRKNEIIDNMTFQRNNDAYIKTIVSDKSKIKEVLNVLLFWFRDLILLKSGADDNQLVNIDRVDEVIGMESRYSFDQLQDIINEIINNIKIFEDNLNVKISLTLLREKIWIN